MAISIYIRLLVNVTKITCSRTAWPILSERGLTPSGVGCVCVCVCVCRGGSVTASRKFFLVLMTNKASRVRGKVCFKNVVSLYSV